MVNTEHHPEEEPFDPWETEYKGQYNYAVPSVPRFSPCGPWDGELPHSSTMIKQNENFEKITEMPPHPVGYYRDDQFYDNRGLPRSAPPPPPPPRKRIGPKKKVPPSVSPAPTKDNKKQNSPFRYPSPPKLADRNNAPPYNPSPLNGRSPSPAKSSPFYKKPMTFDFTKETGKEKVPKTNKTMKAHSPKQPVTKSIINQGKRLYHPQNYDQPVTKELLHTPTKGRNASPTHAPRPAFRVHEMEPSPHTAPSFPQKSLAPAVREVEPSPHYSFFHPRPPTPPSPSPPPRESFFHPRPTTPPPPSPPRARQVEPSPRESFFHSHPTTPPPPPPRVRQVELSPRESYLNSRPPTPPPPPPKVREMEPSPRGPLSLHSLAPAIPPPPPPPPRVREVEPSPHEVPSFPSHPSTTKPHKKPSLPPPSTSLSSPQKPSEPVYAWRTVEPQKDSEPEEVIAPSPHPCSHKWHSDSDLYWADMPRRGTPSTECSMCFSHPMPNKSTKNFDPSKWQELNPKFYKYMPPQTLRKIPAAGLVVPHGAPFSFATMNF